MEQLHAFNAELENKLASAALAFGELTSFCTKELPAYKDKWESADIIQRLELAQLRERILESDKEAAEALPSLAALQTEHQAVLDEAVVLKSLCHSHEEQISRLKQEADEAQSANQAQVKHLQEQLEAALAYRRKCQSLQKELEEAKALLATQQADTSLGAGNGQETEVIAKLQAALEEATSQSSASSMQPLQMRLCEAEQALKREQEAKQQVLAAAAKDKRDWEKQKEVLKAAYREQNKRRKDLERKLIEVEQYATNAPQGGTPCSGGNAVRSPLRATSTPTPSPHASIAKQDPEEQPQNSPSPHVLQPLNLPAQPSVSQKSTEAICTAAAADADTACCPQTISSRYNHIAAKATALSADRPAFDRVYDNPCAEESVPDTGLLPGEGDAENLHLGVGLASPACAAEPELQTIAVPECCMPAGSQDDAMDIDAQMVKGQSPAQADVKEQGVSTSPAEDVIDLSCSPDPKSHPEQRAPPAVAVPEIDRPLSSIGKKAGPKKDTGEQHSGRRDRKRAAMPRFDGLESPEPPGSVGAEPDEHPVRHTVPPSRPGQEWREFSAQRHGHALSGAKVSSARRKRKSPELGSDLGLGQERFAGVGLPAVKPAGRDCSAWQFRNVVSKPTAASDSKVHRARRASQNQYQAFDAVCEAEPQLSPDATQCSPVPEPPIPEEPLPAKASPKQESHGGHSGVQRASRGQQDGPAWKNRGGREILNFNPTRNGVAQTLHLLDMQQGLLRVANTGGSGGGKGTPRLPTIVERAEAARVGACSTGPRPVSTDEPGYKYQDVVRKKAERELLQGFDCQDCKRFYEAVASWGVMGDLPVCGHVNAATSGAAKEQQPSIAQMRQDGSRHRYRYEPPATPEGFWDMGFLDSQDSRMQ